MYKTETITLSNLLADVDNPSEHLVKILYSSFYFAFTSILLTYLGYLALALNAAYLGYEPSLSFDGVEGLTDTRGWSVKRIAFVYLAPPLIGLLASIFGHYKYSVTDHKKSHWQNFYFWLSVNGFVLFYSYLASGLIAVGNFNSKYFVGFVSFFSWLKWDNKLITAVLLLLCLAFAFYARRYGWPVTKSFYSRKLLKKRVGRNIMFVNIVVLPWLIGTLLVSAATFPMDLLFFAIRTCCYVVVFLMILWRINNKRKKVGKIIRGGMTYRSPLLWLVLVAFLVVLSRTLLTKGIHF